MSIMVLWLLIIGPVRRIALLCFPLLHLALICVFRRVKNVNWELQENGSLQNGRQPNIELRWKGYQDAGTFGVGSE